MPIWQICANLLIPNCLRSNLSYSPLAALELYVNGDNLSNIVTLDMDINTLVGSDINSLKQIQELFWVSSAATIQTAIDNYYSILSDEK